MATIYKERRINITIGMIKFVLMAKHKTAVTPMR